MTEKEKIGSDILGYEVPSERISAKKRRDIERAKRELAKKKAKDEEEEKIGEGVPSDLPHEKKLGESTSWEDLSDDVKEKVVHVNEYFRSKPSKKKKVEEVF